MVAPVHIVFALRETDLLGAADTPASVTSGLAKALIGHGHRATLLLPMASDIDPGAHALARKLRKLKVELAGTTHEVAVYTGRAVSGVELVLLQQDPPHAARAFDDDAAARFAAAAAVYVAQARELEGVDVVHGLGPLGVLVTRALKGSLPTVLTTLSDDDADESAADQLLTFVGETGTQVPLGLDSARWNPLTDPSLSARFDPVDMSGKAKNKVALQRELGLPVRGDVPLFALDGTEHPEELDRFAEVASALLRNDIQVVVHVAGAHSRLEGLAARWPDRLAVRADLGADFGHRMLGAAELWLVLPEQACLEVRHLRGQRYGAIPVATATGSIRDALIDADPHLSTGTGFLVHDPDTDGLLATLQRATAAFTQREAFAALQNRVMRMDHGWERSARVHDRVYARLGSSTEAA